MKTMTALGAALLLVCACQRERLEPVCATRTLSVEAVQEEEEEGLKTYISGNTVLWGVSEYLQLYYNDGSDKFAKSNGTSASAYSGKTSATFDFSISPASASSYTFGGFYPAGAVVTSDNGNAASYKAVLPASQSASSGTYDPSAYLMIARPKTGAFIPTSLTATFRKVIALNKLTLTGVNGTINSVEIKASGKQLSGGRYFNLKTGASGAIYSGSDAVSVNYASPLGAGTADIWFTSWGLDLSQGQQLSITVRTSSGTYAKTLTAGSGGLHFYEGKLNKLKVSFSGVTPSATSLADFARAFAGVLDVWEANTASGLTIGNFTVSGHYIPASTTITVGSTTYDKSRMLDVAIQGLTALVDGGTLSASLPSPHNYTWSTDPYNEGAGNGGEFKNATVDLNFLRNCASRQMTYAGNNNRWANFCSYAGSSTSGSPKVTEYNGACCLERCLLVMARFYKYLLDNGISSSITSNCASMALDAGLYAGNVTPVVTKPRISDLATQLSGLLGTWQNTTGTVEGTAGRHYIPASTTITIGDDNYTKAGALELAMRSFQALYAGTATMSSDLPVIAGYAYASSPWKEDTAFSESQVSFAFTKNLVDIMMTYAGNNGNFPNFCSYPKSGYDSQSGSASGQCCLDRALLILCRFFQYVQGNGITSNIASACASAQFNADLYGSAAKKGHVAIWVNSYNMNSISLASLSSRGIDQIFLNYAAVSEHGATAVKNFVTKAAGYNIDVHIWMQCFYKGGSWQYPVDKTNKTYNQTKFDELIAEAKSYLSLGIKGINLDYIRFPGGSGTRASDYNVGSVTGAGAIKEFCRQISVALRAEKSDIVLSACLMADSVTISPGTYGQDPSKMGMYLDILCPMIYRYGTPYGVETAKKIATLYASNSASAKVWAGMETYDGNQKGLSAAQMLSDASDFKGLHDNLTGVALFKYGIGTLPDFTNLWN
ncbi:MAG: hypothetical protein J5871_05690 [Bacteroidales bacterium]|nr:hypothetical protein [Bacteroidales bacterium]